MLGYQRNMAVDKAGMFQQNKIHYNMSYNKTMAL